MSENTKLAIKRLMPVLYVAAIVIGFTISQRTGLIVLIVAAVLWPTAWRLLRPAGPAPEGARRRARNRQRDR
jgi:hypothetical protein